MGYVKISQSYFVMKKALVSVKKLVDHISIFLFITVSVRNVPNDYQ